MATLSRQWCRVPSSGICNSASPSAYNVYCHALQLSLRPADVAREVQLVESSEDDVVHLHGVRGGEGGPATRYSLKRGSGKRFLAFF